MAEGLSQEAERIAAAKQWYVEDGDARDAEAELERRLMAAFGEDVDAIAELAVSAIHHDREKEMRLYADYVLFPAINGFSEAEMNAALHAASDELEADDE